MKVTHPYVEVPDQSDAGMCAKDTSLNSPGGRGGLRPSILDLCSYKYHVLGEHWLL